MSNKDWTVEGLPRDAALLVVKRGPNVGLATDLATDHGGTDTNKRDGTRQVGRLNVDDLHI